MPEQPTDAAAAAVPDAGDDTLRVEAARVLEVHEIVWISHEDGWDCGCNERGDLPPMPSILDAKRHQADALLPLIREHVAKAELRADARARIDEIRLRSRVEQAEAVIKRVEALTYASDDGAEYQHDGLHPDLDGHPECPACWAEDIRRALGWQEATP